MIPGCWILEGNKESLLFVCYFTNVFFFDVTDLSFVF